MIQIQDSRFILNWRKQENQEYPSYDKLYPEFQEHYSVFEKFVRDAGNDAPVPNQWEVTYVNHLLLGRDWKSPRDWLDWFPILSNAAKEPEHFESFSGEWIFGIFDKQGRLYISFKHARIGDETGPEALVVQLTARGPRESGQSLRDGLDIGHDAIVANFTAISSADAHKAWRRIQ